MRRVAIMMLSVLLLSAVATSVGASDLPGWCTPKTAATPNASGSPLMLDLRQQGAWAAWWCPADPPAGDTSGKTWFRVYPLAGLWGYVPTLGQITAASERINVAGDELARESQARTEVAATVRAASSQVDECRRLMLLRDGCVSLMSANQPGYPGPFTPSQIAAYCIPQVDCDAIPPPPPPADIYRTPVTGTFTVYTAINGTLKTIVSGKKAPANALASCATLQAMSGTSRYCSFPGAASGEVTYVVKAAQ